MVVNTLLDPIKVRAAVSEAIQHQVECVAEEDTVRVDTPYILQDGHLLRVILRPGPAGIMVSDGGYATAQVEMHVVPAGDIETYYSLLRRIAHELSLEWQGDFRFVAEDLPAAAQRLPVLARAVDRAIGLHMPRSKTQPMPEATVVPGDHPPLAPGQVPSVSLRSRLRVELDQLQVIEPGIFVKRGEWLPAHDLSAGVKADHLVKRNGSQAVVDALTSRSTADRVSADFHILVRAAYPAHLIAVFDEQSGDIQMLVRRFLLAKPEKAIVVPADEAVTRVRDLLGIN